MQLANDNLDQLPQKVNGGVIELCSAIDSPGDFVAKNLNNLISQQLQQTADLKAENLPLYAKILSKFTSSFVKDTLLGKSGSQVLDETGRSLLSATANAVGQAAYDSATYQPNQNGTQLIFWDKTNTLNSFKISWDVSSIKGAAKANIYKGITFWRCSRLP